MLDHKRRDTLFQKLWISLRGCQEVKPNPTAYAPETDALRLWSLEECSQWWRNRCPWSPVQREIYVLGEDFQRLLNNIGVWIYIHAQNTATIPIYVGNQFLAKARLLYEDVTGVVTYRNSFYKNLLSWQSKMVVCSVKQLKPNQVRTSWPSSYNIENFSAMPKKMKPQRIRWRWLPNSAIRNSQSRHHYFDRNCGTIMCGWRNDQWCWKWTQTANRIKRWVARAMSIRRLLR